MLGNIPSFGIFGQFQRLPSVSQASERASGQANKQSINQSIHHQVLIQHLLTALAMCLALSAIAPRPPTPFFLLSFSFSSFSSFISSSSSSYFTLFQLASLSACHETRSQSHSQGLPNMHVLALHADVAAVSGCRIPPAGFLPFTS